MEQKVSLPAIAVLNILKCNFLINCSRQCLFRKRGPKLYLCYDRMLENMCFIC